MAATGPPMSRSQATSTLVAEIHSGSNLPRSSPFTTYWFGHMRRWKFFASAAAPKAMPSVPVDPPKWLDPIRFCCNG